MQNTDQTTSSNNTTNAPLHVGMLIYPEMTAIDMVAPQLIFTNLPNAQVHLIWKNMDPVRSDSGLTVLPTCTFEDCPHDLDVLFVGGSKSGTWPLLGDTEIISFLADHGQRAKWITSVCTGSLLLAAAGLLDGYLATSYWAVRHLLDSLGAISVDGRVVHDRNRITGGGVTAGMDFALTIAARLCGDQYAKTLQLLVEYDPQPPYETGNPSTAEPGILQAATAIYSHEVDCATNAVKKIQRA
jgi:cyclohexyl-isocyanide hydratase